MKKLLFVFMALILSFSLANANDLLNKASNGALNSNSKGVKLLNNEELASVKGGYYWVTGLADTSGLTYDNLGNIYGTIVARGVVYPDQWDMLWENFYVQVEYKISWNNPRFSNSGYQSSYTFSVISRKTGDFAYFGNIYTGEVKKAQNLTEQEIYSFDPKIYYASKALQEASNAFQRYQQQVLNRYRF